MKTWAYALIIAAATLWGIISIFVKGLSGYGFTTLQIVAIRGIVSACLLVLYISVKDRTMLKIRVADGRYFIGTGICSLAFFNWCYFTTIRETSVAVAAILLYTAPIFVLLLSRVFFGERLTGRKIAALVTTFAGCALVVGVVPEMGGNFAIWLDNRPWGWDRLCPL
jgi:drug/metabolite transporter (DMT)-like permease